MNRLISELTDRYMLHQLHKERSAVSHFNLQNIEPLLQNSFTAFYAEPAVPDIKFIRNRVFGTYDIGTYCYESEIKNNNSSNENAIGYYHRNTANMDSVNVILVHGWRMHRINRINNIYLDSFMNRGFNIYHFIMPYHFDRNSEDSLYSGELMVTADIGRTLLSIKQAVSDLRALIKWLKRNTKGKVVLIGISLGGYLVNLTSAFESEIDILISVFYANSLANSVWNTIPGRYIKQDFISNSFSYEQLKKCWAVINPGLFNPVIPADSILLFSAIYDKYIDFKDAEELWVNWGKPKRLVYNCGHAGLALFRKRIARDSLEFIDSKL